MLHRFRILLRKIVPHPIQMYIIEHIFRPRQFRLFKKPKVFHAQINKYEDKIRSQNGEDGIIQYILDSIHSNTTNCIEIGIGDGSENNTANLIYNKGWSGLWIEKDPVYIQLAQKYLNKYAPQNSKLICTEITPENCNQIIKQSITSKDIDLLSIDIDGLDYWVWKELNIISPKIVVIEFNSLYGKSHSIVVPRTEQQTNTNFGASLSALTELAKQKNYLLLGCDSTGSNAFFLRSDLKNETLNPLSIEQAYYSSV